MHCTVDDSDYINLIRFNVIYDSIWTAKDFPDLLHIIFRYSAPRQRELGNLI